VDGSLNPTLLKKILYISYDGMTDPLGQSQVLPYLVGLTKKGCQFHLISFEKQERFEKFESTIRQICSDAGIEWHPLSYTKKPPLLSTIYDVQRMKKLAHSLHKTHQFDIIHCRSYISALVGMGMKHRFGTKFLFDMRGFWADERVEGGIWKLSNPLFKTVYSYFKKKERRFFNESDAIVSLTHKGKEVIVKEFGIDAPKINVIPCCADLNLFDRHKVIESELLDLRTKLGIEENTKILGYVGSIGTWYMLPEMLDFFKSLKNKDATWRFLIVSGEAPEVIYGKANEKHIENEAIIISSCLHKEVPKYICIFDLSVFFIRPSFSKQASSPTKQGELMAMGIPIVCNAGVGDTDLVIKTYDAGAVLSETNPSAYEAFSFPIEGFNKERTVIGAQEFYGLENGVNTYFSIYTQLKPENS
jgi:glycosyltransferase involved in cell wall biosynthesis